MTNKRNCSRCEREISQFSLRFFSLNTIVFCPHCGKINKLSFVTAKDKKSWILLDLLLLLGIVFFFVTLKFNKNSQLEGVYLIVSLGVCSTSKYFLNKIIAKGKVFINTEDTNKN